jgi:hypothetical protein
MAGGGAADVKNVACTMVACWVFASLGGRGGGGVS